MGAGKAVGYADNTICLSHLDHDVERYLKDKLQWPNPDYIKRQEAGRSTWNCPRNIILWTQRGNDLIVPFGLLKELWGLGISVSPSPHISASSAPKGTCIEGLYDYQRFAVDSAMREKQGIIVAPCGAGKTQIGIAICATYGYRTLWLTHTYDLLKQSMDRAKNYLSMPIGTITGGKIRASEGITFATVQTMSKIDLSAFHDYWDVIIVDECHRCVGTPTQMTMFWRVVNSLSARHKFGLTATPKRSDGMEKAMYALLGPVIHEVSRESVKNTTTPVYVRDPICTGWVPDFERVLKPDGTLDYVDLIADCVENEARNRIVAQTIDDATKIGPTLVLSERIIHLATLGKMCDNSSANLSTARKECRNDLIHDMETGKIKILFATYAIAKEGLDIPCLRNLVMASPVKNDITVTQSAGRVMRAYPGKDVGNIWDFEDDMHMLKKWLRKRLSIYRRLDCE